MKFYDGQHAFYYGADLHTKRMYLRILDQEGNKRLHRNMKAKPNDFLNAIKDFLRLSVRGSRMHAPQAYRLLRTIPVIGRFSRWCCCMRFMPKTVSPV